LESLKSSVFASLLFLQCLALFFLILEYSGLSCFGFIGHPHM
jgi:hypothetical protein